MGCRKTTTRRLVPLLAAVWLMLGLATARATTTKHEARMNLSSNRQQFAATLADNEIVRVFAALLPLTPGHFYFVF